MGSDTGTRSRSISSHLIMTRRSFPTFATVLVSLLCLAAACQSESSTAEPSSTTGVQSITTSTTASGDPSVFDDHTVADIDSVVQFEQLARSDDTTGRATVKFAIPDLAEPGVVWLDSGFYELHDEWYWFRLLNGEPVPGLDTAPLPTGSVPRFDTIDDVYAWAEQRPDDLPLDLTFTPDGDRLYSSRYYQLALREAQKSYGLGSVTRFPSSEDTTSDRWVIELEFSEATTPASITQFFGRLSEALPPEIADALEWVPRSPLQDTTATEMEDNDLEFGDRIVRYSDLVPRGEVAVYNPGLSAGRLRLIETSDDLNSASTNDILVMENVPDWLPPASAVLTSAPQTPLAHVNLLARNRGIPNASVAGLLDDPAIAIAARSRAYAVVGASGSNELEITLISRDQFEQWRELGTTAPIAVPPVDLSAMPTIVSLTDLAAGIDSEADVEELRPTIGGKSAGFLALIGAVGVTTPDTPLAITVAPYARHLEQVTIELDAMLTNDDFGTDARIRFLLLEGPEEYAEVYSSERNAQLADEFDDRHPDGPIREILDADGFMNLFRDADMATADLEEITDSLRTTFGDLAETQGLRFRSSSSVEDIEGFTGAGLYDSNTGFLDPEAQPNEDDHKKSVERTIKKTWASYWSFEAFEERRLENVEHRSGAMGVLVHPRFDDPLEDNNGVATFTLLPQNRDSVAEVAINVQLGDESVTNPDPESDVLPEEIVVSVAEDGSLTIDRVANSTLAANRAVLDDDAVTELVGQLEAVTRLWRDRINADLPAAQQVDTVTLDFEFKSMAAGWPARADRTLRPARLVVKQARSLDPGLRGLAAEVLDLPIPRDVLARATLIERLVCPDGSSVMLTLTDPLLAPDMGFASVPLAIDQDGTVLDEPPSGDACERSILVTTPGRLLVELLEQGEGLTIG